MNNYQEQAKRTNANLGSEKLNLSHMVLGMISEMNELQNAIDNDDKVNIGEELADICWYVANYCTIKDIDFNILLKDAPITGDSTIEDIYYDISLLSDIVKKYIAYNKDINKKDELIYLNSIMFGVMDYCMLYKLDINQILQNNINKLKVRFPDKFNEEKAKSRDLEKELVELKK